jgi:hypothetical protein
LWQSSKDLTREQAIAIYANELKPEDRCAPEKLSLWLRFDVWVNGDDPVK